jgi:hypothetical protein
MDVINSCDALDVTLPRRDQLTFLQSDFKNISFFGVMDGCVGALDGYLMWITTPLHTECGSVGAYFSGHYCTYGVNI